MTSTPGERRMNNAERELRRAYGRSVMRSWLIALIVVLAIPIMVGLVAWALS